MSIYTLDNDEAIVLQAYDVTVGSNSRVDLILTNKKLIQINKSLFGKDKNSESYPLEEMRILDGKANILIGRDKNGEKQLKLFFNNVEKNYHFSGLLLENKWASAIEKAHKQRLKDIESQKKLTDEKGSIIDNLKSALSVGKGLIAPKNSTSKICKCRNCGAELIGHVGTEVTCSYCDAVTIIK